jgi:anthranilate phosphoribosyltransferase
MDNCGMGGDLYRTLNVSTIAAIIASCTGIPICKHGSPGNTDATGSSDFLEYCGVNLYPDKNRVIEAIEKLYFGYTDALDTRYKSIHLQTHKSARLAHMNDIIGPMTNPLHPKLLKKRILGVNHLMQPRKVAEAYTILNRKNITNLQHALFVRGFVHKNEESGMDEVSVFEGGTKVAELKNDKIEEYYLNAKDFGIRQQRYIEPPRGKIEKAEYGLKILKGEIKDSNKYLCLANAAILVYLAKNVSFKEGFEIAKNALESGEPLEKLNAYIQLTK